MDKHTHNKLILGNIRIDRRKRQKMNDRQLIFIKKKIV